MKIVDYDVISTYLVQKSIEEGWQPFGSPFVTNNNAAMQAIVKYEETHEKNRN